MCNRGQRTAALALSVSQNYDNSASSFVRFLLFVQHPVIEQIYGLASRFNRLWTAIINSSLARGTEPNPLFPSPGITYKRYAAPHHDSDDRFDGLNTVIYLPAELGCVAVESLFPDPRNLRQYGRSRCSAIGGHTDRETVVQPPHTCAVLHNTTPFGAPRSRIVLCSGPELRNWRENEAMRQLA